MFIRLATGRHFEPVPEGYATSGLWPLGHMQPWGQIYVRDLAKGVCDNVTPFFTITVQECYDCYYLNSFITDASFKFKEGVINTIPPCCGSVFSDLGGSGKDRYYMSLSFDNTYNNPYLNPASAAYAGNNDGLYSGVEGLGKVNLPGDGITPDLLPYIDVIRSSIGSPNPFEVRFTLNGIMQYNWSLQFINASDVARDFIGTATYTANGYGFIGLICSYLSGTVGIAEQIKSVAKCCQDSPWYDGLYPNSWYGKGFNLQQYPWSNFFQSPINVPTSLSFHVGYNQAYEPGWNWPVIGGDAVPADPNAPVDTLDPNNPTTIIPGSRWVNQQF
jgi:hypothetical protein